MIAMMILIEAVGKESESNEEFKERYHTQKNHGCRL